jgi:hypothetical protein
MSNSKNRLSLRQAILNKITAYSQKAAGLGQQARQLVFGFGLRSTMDIDRCSLPVKLLTDHRILQRQSTYQQAGGVHSGMAEYGLNKARQQQKI